MKATLFSDPNCPFCYVTEERLHEAGLADQVQWCGVQHAPELPVPTAVSGAVSKADLQREVESIRRLAPEALIEVPLAKPNTGRAIIMAAAASRLDSGAGRRFVRSLYTAFWQQGVDLADEMQLLDLARAAGLPEIFVRQEDRDTALSCQHKWMELGTMGVPLLIREDGRALYGLVNLNELTSFLTSG